MNMKRIAYFTALALLLCSLCACGGKDNTDANANAASDNFSTEMMIEASTDVTIVEMP